MKKVPLKARLTAVFRAVPMLAALMPVLAQAVDAAPTARPAAPASGVATAAPRAASPATLTAPAAAQVAPPTRKTPAGHAPGKNAATAQASNRAVPTVAIDVGRKPVAAKDQPVAVGQVEFAFNQRFADQLARALLARKVAVKRIPAGLTPTQRAKAAAGATLLVSVNHEVLQAAEKSQAHAHAGYALAVSRQQAEGSPAATECARQVSAALLGTGRHHSLMHSASAKVNATGGTPHPWADRVLGVQAQDDLPVLKLAPVPAMRLQVAVLANPAESQRAQNPAWIRVQAKAVADGLVACVKRAGSGSA